MSAAPEGTAEPTVAVLRALVLLEGRIAAQHGDLAALRSEVRGLRALLETVCADVGALVSSPALADAPPPAGAAPLAAGGGTFYPAFPSAFRTRSGGGGR